MKALVKHFNKIGNFVKEVFNNTKSSDKVVVESKVSYKEEPSKTITTVTTKPASDLPKAANAVTPDETGNKIVKMRNNGESFESIAKQMKVSVTTIHNILLKHNGLLKEEYKFKPNEKQRALISEIIRLNRQGKSIKDISTALKVSTNTVRKYINFSI